MTERLPRVSAAEAACVLEKAGFFPSRQRGSHKSIKMQKGAGCQCLSFRKREYPKVTGTQEMRI